jgi:NAD(P)-dependent dehydrogenase (short-subunit alcohol dehydrogenase family)
MDSMESKRTAIITGGGSGIGLAIASRFVKADIRTIIIGRDTNKLTIAQQQLGNNCHLITHDLNDLPSLLPRRKGNIINISSMASRYGIPKVIAYTASKAAIEGMTRAMAVELSPEGINVNCIAPGFIATEMSAKALNGDPERKQKVFARTPMGRLGDPGEIGDAAFFLASDQASYLTGVILPVDGGNSIGF